MQLPSSPDAHTHARAGGCAGGGRRCWCECCCCCCGCGDLKSLGFRLAPEILSQKFAPCCLQCVRRKGGWTMERCLQVLEPVVKSARGRGSQRLPPKVHAAGYVAQHGITCVGNATDATIARFSKPFLERIKADPHTTCFLPVPAHGHHFTLIGMEYAKALVDLDDEDLANTLRQAQRRLNASFRPFKDNVIFEASPQDKRSGLSLRASGKALYRQFRRAEEGMKTALGIHRKHPQAWHLTLGYFKPKTPKQVRQRAEDHIRMHIQAVLQQMGNRTVLSFQSPQICTYEDHTRYTPLFPDLA